MKSIVFIVFMVFLTSCASISFAPVNKETSQTKAFQRKAVILDEEGNIIVRSGSHRDNRRGYYFDTTDGLCKEVFYSTGPGCIPPPFKTIEECKSCRRTISTSQN